MKGIQMTDPTEPFSTHPGLYNAMLGLNYAGLFLCISATISQLIMTEIFGELPLNAARKSVGEGQKSLHPNGAISAKLSDLLVRYGARPGFRWVSWHCEFHLEITAPKLEHIAHLGPFTDRVPLPFHWYFRISFERVALYYGGRTDAY